MGLDLLRHKCHIVVVVELEHRREHRVGHCGCCAGGEGATTLVEVAKMVLRCAEAYDVEGFRPGLLRLA